MGCDIHMIVQRKQKWDSGNAYWSTKLPPVWWPRDAWDAEQIATYTAQLPLASAARMLAYYLSRWYSGRNYDLFGVLANVRNSANWPSIAPRRGLPGGFDPALEDDCDLGDHSFTWMTLTEVLAYDWKGTTATFEREGTVSAYDCCREWCDMTLPALVRQAEEWGVSHDDVRLVMGFDS